ncbi:DUF4158 domain-containing protein [Streptomyces sp. 8N706]|uniref:DUF4158 domain-containing protein n=1 Tax=Streptomyces sp. 8N706 TaxID=3457416 RepID=UPI003FD6503E
MNRLGFALLLKFFEVEAQFPEGAGEIPAPAVAYVAQQVKVPVEEFAAYDWAGRAIKRHRMEMRGAFGFRECTDAVGGPGRAAQAAAHGEADLRSAAGLRDVGACLVSALLTRSLLLGHQLQQVT